MTSSETSSQQQHQMHLQCVQGCSLFVRHHHHLTPSSQQQQHHNHHQPLQHHLQQNKLLCASSASSSLISPTTSNNINSSASSAPTNHINTFSTVPGIIQNSNSHILSQHQNQGASASSSAAIHPDNNNTPPIITTAAASIIAGKPTSIIASSLVNSSGNSTTGSLTATASALSPSSSQTSSTSSSSSSAYLSCCSTLSLANGGSSLKISDNHLSTKLLRSSSAPYSVGGAGLRNINNNNNNKSVVVSDENSDNTSNTSIMSSATINPASTQVNGTSGGGGLVDNSSSMMKLEPNGNTIEINSNSAQNAIMQQQQYHSHPHLNQNGSGGGCCHHTTNTPANNGPMNHFGGANPSTVLPNGMLDNCDLSNGHHHLHHIHPAAHGVLLGSSGEMMMDTTTSGGGGGCANNNNNNNSPVGQNQCISNSSHLQQHHHHLTNASSNNTLVSSPIHPGVVTLAPSPPSTSPCNNNNNNGSPATSNNNNMIILANGGVNGPSNAGNNMSPGENEDDDEHDCDDDKVINGDTFGDAGELPDPDSIKMFVGQIPKHMNETDLRELFEKYGRVYQINVLRDKATKQSKGCCFVTFFTRKAALDAQNALHNVKTLPGMNNTVQMKPADNENRYDRKLFIGMISKKLNEADVRNMFSRYGTIDDCTVLRCTTGESKGCAFVTFSTKQSAQNAIKAVHQSVTMEGCSSPIVVKFADTPKDKDQKRQSQMVTNPATLLSSLSSQALSPVQHQYYSTILQHQLQQQQSASQTGFFSQLSPLGVQGLTGIGGLGSTSATGLPALSSAHLSATTNAADLATLTGLLSGVTQTPHSLTVQNLHTLAALGNSSLSPTGLTSYHGLRSTAVNTKQVRAEGPEGCNLFIYHLPPECGDAELAQMFVSFGTVLSAKVFIDKQTNLSKCFGFVSFDNQLSAQMAIQAMNGFQVGVKRLKVQLKRSKSKDAAKPY